MWAGTVQDHAADGPEEDPQGGHGDDSDEDGVERFQHVARAADLVGLHKVGVLGDLFHWRRDTDHSKNEIEQSVAIRRERTRRDLRISLRRSSSSGGMSGSVQKRNFNYTNGPKRGCKQSSVHLPTGMLNGHTKASPLHSIMLSPFRTLMSSTAISPQLFASIRLSITT